MRESTNLVGKLSSSGNVKALSFAGCKREGKLKDSIRYWNCLCLLCGKIFEVRTSHFMRLQSCGCLRSKNLARLATRHGLSRSRVYKIYRGILQRCYNPKYTSYKDYGGRGITVCEEWRQSFEAFRDWALENGYTDELTIDRQDNNGPYEPENCQWVTMEKQGQNRRTTKKVEINGESMSTKKAIEKYSKVCLFSSLDRLSKGWSVLDALFTPAYHWPISGNDYGFTDIQLAAFKSKPLTSL